MKKYLLIIGLLSILVVSYLLAINKIDSNYTKNSNQGKQSFSVENHTVTSKTINNNLNPEVKQKNIINPIIEPKEQAINFSRSVLNIDNITHQTELYAFDFLDKKMAKIIVQFSDEKVSSIISGEDQNGEFIINNGRSVIDRGWTNYPPLTYEDAFAKITSLNSKALYGENNLYYINTSSVLYYKFPSDEMDYYVNVENGEITNYNDAMKSIKEGDDFIKKIYQRNNDGTISMNEEFSKKHLNQKEINDIQLTINEINQKILSGEVELDEDFQFKNKPSIEVVPVNPSLTKPTILPLPNSESQ